MTKIVLSKDNFIFSEKNAILVELQNSVTQLVINLISLPDIYSL